MSMGRTKLLLAFALFGFLIGSAAYFLFDWILTNTTIGIRPVPILAIITAPWFISGIAGSFLSMTAIYVSARYSKE